VLGMCPPWQARYRGVEVGADVVVQGSVGWA
jgi:hypothetical protein